MKLRLTYSNLIASIALFVSLGGVSYAATTVASNSVGTSQLRSGAVTLPKLAFPLGVSSVDAQAPVKFPGRFCPSQDACPAQAATDVVTTGLTLRKPADVLLIASGSFNLVQLNTAPANVNLELKLQGNLLGATVQAVSTTGGTTASIEHVVACKAGRQTFSLAVSAIGVGTSTSVAGAGFQLSAIALPRA